MSTRDHTFKVETLEAGQRRAYGDSYYYYIVESERSIEAIKTFCTEILSKAIPQEQWSKENNCADNHFRDYYTCLKVLNKTDFLEDGLNKVEYRVVSPSTH